MFGKPHDHKPCALRILKEFYSEEEAASIALNFTCFPMDCQVASLQAMEFILESKEEGGGNDG